MKYNDAYYRRHREQYHDWEKRLANDLFTCYQVTSVLDLGCGVGSYLDAAFDLNIQPIKGYEISLEAAWPHIPSHLRSVITKKDITEPLTEDPYDCVWSVEVGEHLLPSGTEQFVDNLISLSNRLIVLTCAPPGQPGTNHINLRPKDEWISLLTEKGVRLLAEDVHSTVSRWKTLGAPSYILRNLMIFEK